MTDSESDPEADLDAGDATGGDPTAGSPPAATPTADPDAPFAFPSEAWLEAWRHAVDADGVPVASDLSATVLLIVRGDERCPTDAYFRVDIEDGHADGCAAVDAPTGGEYGFALAADYGDWLRLIEGDLSTIQALMSGVFDFRGDLGAAMANAGALTAMVDRAGTVDTQPRY